jgi:hypothetical protein
MTVRNTPEEGGDAGHAEAFGLPAIALCPATKSKRRTYHETEPVTCIGDGNHGKLSVGALQVITIKH